MCIRIYELMNIRAKECMSVRLYLDGMSSNTFRSVPNGQTDMYIIDILVHTSTRPRMAAGRRGNVSEQDRLG